MKKASSSLLLLVFAALLVSLQSYAQISVQVGKPDRVRPGQQPQPLPQPQMPLPQNGGVIQEQVNQAMRAHERLRLADLLRLPRQQRAELLSLRIMAESLIQGPAQLELSVRGRVLAVEKVKRNLNEVLFIVPIGTQLEEVELAASAEIYLSSIRAEVREERGPDQGRLPQVSPNTLITLQVNEISRGHLKIPLVALAKQQLGVTLEGAQIERVVIEGQPYGYSQAGIHIQMNNRIVSETKYLSLNQRQLPIPLNTLEEVDTLQAIVTGDAQISHIRIRIGQVRPRLPQGPRAERVFVGRQIDQRMGLSLSELLRYETRMIRSITIEGRSVRQAQAQISLLGMYSEIQGAVFVSSSPSRSVIVLRRPLAAHELRLEAAAPVLVDSLEIEFENRLR